MFLSFFHRVLKVTSDDISSLRALKGTPLEHMLTPTAPVTATVLGDVQVVCLCASPSLRFLWSSPEKLEMDAGTCWQNWLLCSWQIYWFKKCWYLISYWGTLSKLPWNITVKDTSKKKAYDYCIIHVSQLVFFTVWWKIKLWCTVSDVWKSVLCVGCMASAHSWVQTVSETSITFLYNFKLSSA